MSQCRECETRDAVSKRDRQEQEYHVVYVEMFSNGICPSIYTCSEKLKKQEKKKTWFNKIAL